MGFPGKALARAAGGLGRATGGALGGGGMKPGRYVMHKDGSISKIPPKKRAHRGARMPRIIYEMYRDMIETNRTMRVAMLANVMHGGTK